jgi:hypothetical protein
MGFNSGFKGLNMNLYCSKRRTLYKVTKIFSAYFKDYMGKKKKGKNFISMNQLCLKNTHRQTCTQLLTIRTAAIEAFIPAEN